MTKQFGRNPPAMRALVEGGIARFVAVDMACARVVRDTGCHLGHIGHLSQIPRAEAGEAAAMQASYWTVFNREKAAEAAAAAAAIGHTQPVLARIHAEGDTFYRGHEGGFPVADLTDAAKSLDRMAGLRFAGITTFPAMLFDEGERTVRPTRNLATLEQAAETLRRLGFDSLEINAPGTNSVELFAMLASAGATQVEPGHGLTGTTPLHAVRELPEQPAILYVTEVSHFHGGLAYCLGGGLYMDPVFEPYPVKALVGADPDSALRRRVGALMPTPGAIDYYGMLETGPQDGCRIGDTVVFGFRPQVFFTRALVAPLSGVRGGTPKVEGIWTSGGRPAKWGAAAR